jgi:hypothetical protein
VITSIDGAISTVIAVAVGRTYRWDHIRRPFQVRRRRNKAIAWERTTIGPIQIGERLPVVGSQLSCRAIALDVARIGYGAATWNEGQHQESKTEN